MNTMRLARKDRSVLGRRGQALVEFALILPLLLILVFGIIEFARAWNQYQVLTDAAREAARTAVIDNPTMTQDSVQGVIQAALTRARMDYSSATVTLTGWRAGRGTLAEVQIEYPFTFTWLKPFLAWSDAATSITLTTRFVMRNE
jgi:Flp pilus assembly protein TadG